MKIYKFKCVGCSQAINANFKIKLGNLSYYYGLVNKEIDDWLSGKTFPANLITCNKCGLTQQELFESTIKATEIIYNSQTSAASTPMSNQGWGQIRAKEFFNNINFLFPPKTVLEIGCQNGYLLYELYKRGAKKLIGIEPSPQVPFVKDDFEANIYNEFFDHNRFEKESFDSVISLFVLEHLQNPTHYLESTARVLTKNGQIIIAIPNASYQMRMGDPGLFMHEHISHFTRQSLRNIFSLAGLKIVNYNETKSDIYLVAQKEHDNISKLKTSNNSDWSDPLIQYDSALKNLLHRFKMNLINKSRVGLWGACPTSANLINLSEITNYVAFDGDSSKQNNKISGINGSILNPSSNNIKELVDTTAVIPLGYQKIIAKILKEYKVPYFELFNSS